MRPRPGTLRPWRAVGNQPGNAECAIDRRPSGHGRAQMMLRPDPSTLAARGVIINVDWDNFPPGLSRLHFRISTVSRWALAIVAVAGAASASQVSPIVRGDEVTFVVVGDPSNPPRIVADFNG